MRSSFLSLLFGMLVLSGCVKLGVAPRSAGEMQGARFATTQPLNLYVSFGNYPDRTITSYFVVPFGIANRFHTEIGRLPAGTTVEIVDVVDRTALGVPHSRIFRVRLAPDAASHFGLRENLIEISNHQLLDQVKDAAPRLREEYFLRL